MKHLIFIVISLIWQVNVNAQLSIDQVIKQVEANNVHLLSMKQYADAEKLENQTGLYPQNPEVGFNYLWGDPAVSGNRKDFSISQTFDFPSAYIHKSAIADLRNNQSDIKYLHDLLKLRHETRLVCIDLVYFNSAISEANRRIENARLVADAFKLKFNSGDANIIEYNKAQLDLLNAQKQLEALLLEKDKLLLTLTQLNNGIPIEFNNTNYEVSVIDADFDEWYKSVEPKNPDLRWIQQEYDIINRQVSLNSALALPKVSVGYMSESLPIEKFNGLTMGITIPLFENKYTVKSSKARLSALQSLQKDNKLTFYYEMKSKYNSAVRLAENVNNYRSNLSLFNNSKLLKKALDAGEISLLDYILELSLYYDSLDQLLQLEKERNKADAELLLYAY